LNFEKNSLLCELLKILKILKITGEKMKKLFKLLFILIFVLGVTTVVGFTYISSIVENGVEKYGSEMTQAEVKLGKFDLCIFCGKAEIKDFFVGNPEGFKSSEAFKLGGVNVKLEPKTILDDVIIINEIRITNPEITYEMTIKGSNVGAIQKNINEYVGASGETTSDKGDEKSGGAKKVIIENLYIEEAKVRLVASLGEQEEMKEVVIPEIHLKDLGKEKGGMEQAEALAVVMNEINKELLKHVGTGGVVDSITNGVKSWFD